MRSEHLNLASTMTAKYARNVGNEAGLCFLWVKTGQSLRPKWD